MEMQPVSSSNVDSVGYDPATEKLHVKYKSGGLYEYSGVPQSTHDELMSADSIGAHLHQRIKGVHPHTRVDE